MKLFLLSMANQQQIHYHYFAKRRRQLEQFEIFEASNFMPALQAQFPEIRAYSGRGITDRYATLKLSFSPQGIQTMVFRTEKDNEFMEPYSADHKVYAVYRLSKRERQPSVELFN